jgi:hypothetical protein
MASAEGTPGASSVPMRNVTGGATPPALLDPLVVPAQPARTATATTAAAARCPNLFIVNSLHSIDDVVDGTELGEADRRGWHDLMRDQSCG